MTLTQFLGDSITHLIPLRWQGAAFEPGSDWLLIFTAKADTEDADDDALIQKASGYGISVEGSTASVALVPDDTVTVAERTLLWDIQAQHTVSGEVRTVATGNLRLSRDVTRETTPSVPIHTTEPPVPTGPAGPAPVITVGTVTTGAPGTAAAVEITGTAPNYTLNVTIPAGFDGDDAAVTTPNVQAAGAQMTSIGFLDDFSRLDRYAPGSQITHLVTLPEIGPAWRSRLGAAPEPTIVTQGLTCGDTAGLYYLSNSVPTPAGKFSLGFEFSLTKTAQFATALNQVGINVTYGASELIANDRGHAAGLATMPVHINFNLYGITSIDYWTGAVIPCVNGAYNGSHIPWNPSGGSMSPSGRMVLLLKAEGEYLEVTLVGVGSLRFKDAGLASRIGAERTHFWWEPNGGGHIVGGTGFKYSPKLHRVWGNAEELDQRPDWGSNAGGNLPSLAGLGPHRLPGPVELPDQLRLRPTGADLTVDAWPAVAYTAIATGISTAVRVLGGMLRINGGHIRAEGGFLCNVGQATPGESVFGRAIVAVFRQRGADYTLTAVRNSIAGTLADFGGVAVTNGLEPGDQEEWTIHLNLVGANPKRLLIDFSIYLNTVFDSNVSGTPLNAISGPCILRINRTALTATSHLMHAELKLPDGTWLPTQRGAFNMGASVTTFYMRFRTTCDANAIVQESLKHVVTKQTVH